ncbi:MAG: DUF934 domain-containing protein [Pseudomonadales bacterium]|nr:DUF934 domain-containing protein [Pseudomonadales bacterium]
MPKQPNKIIKDRKIIDDSWSVVSDDVDKNDIPADGDIIFSVDFWVKNQKHLESRSNGRLGLMLESTDEINLFSDNLGLFDIISINFPAFADGRGYSVARLLRERYHFQKEIRAVGDVLRDQLFYMYRCGFNAFAIREDRCIEDALNAYNDFTVTYQAASDNLNPIYRRA